jgi:hypothetical protein
MQKSGLTALLHLKAFIAFLMIWLLFFSVKLNADEIFVGGTLFEDQVWTSDNIYIVDQDLRIGQNISLTILPGVTVRINQGRGIHLNGGDLIVGDILGVDTDSVRFIGNYRHEREGWKWKGIIIEEVGDENLIKLLYVSIQDAEIALDLKQCSYVLVRNSSIIKNQNIGIRMTDCSRCVIQDCFISQNWDGVEMAATSTHLCTENTITNNYILNSNHNIYMHVENNGVFSANTISYNLIEAANNGIWMDAETDGSSSGNIISKNVFVNNGSGFGFGLILAFDSTHVENNIFWQNNVALNFDALGQNSYSRFNSFFQNVKGVLVGGGSTGNDISHSTFSRQYDTDLEIKETLGVNFKVNNLFPIDFEEPIVFNLTKNNLLIDDNFWDTDQSSMIDQLIWDYNDDPLLGKLYYEPVVEHPNTELPISPPTQVTKQWVDGRVKVSWDDNPESDLAGYRVYFTNFEYYHFDSVNDVGRTHFHFLDNSILSDSIAVTAYDDNGSVADAQLEGFESPYSFAEYYPYAGEDQEFCINQYQFVLQRSSAPFSYTTLSWKTNGDGTFSNPAIVNPAYFPGEQDLLNGSVILSINVLRNGKWLSDALELTFVDLAQVSAGVDSTIFVDESLFLAGAEEQFVNGLFWLSDGDGQFSSDTVLNPIYVPGDMDKISGKVDLILTGENACGFDRDTLHLSIVPRYTINGAVWNGDYPSDFCAVVAIETSSTSDRAIAIAGTDLSGKFMFNTLIPGNYLIYAVPDTLMRESYYPGYYVNADRWHMAYGLTLDADIYDVDIHLPELEYQLPEGKGEISGHFTQPEFAFQDSDIYCQSWFDDNVSNAFCKSGPSNITILLYNSTHEKVLDYTITDINGNFFFRQLPMGNYIVDAEMAGFLTNPSSIISLNPQQYQVDDVELNVMQKQISIKVNDNIQGIKDAEISVYPNPAKTDLNLQITGRVEGLSHLLVFDSFGRMIWMDTWVINEDTTLQKYVLDVSDYRSGIYFGIIEGSQEKIPFSFIVR